MLIIPYRVKKKGRFIMKKSEMYKKAMIAVLESVSIPSEEKLEIARELIDKEDLELFRERMAEEKDNDEN